MKTIKVTLYGKSGNSTSHTHRDIYLLLPITTHFNIVTSLLRNRVRVLGFIFVSGEKIWIYMIFQFMPGLQRWFRMGEWQQYTI